VTGVGDDSIVGLGVAEGLAVERGVTEALIVDVAVILVGDCAGGAIVERCVDEPTDDPPAGIFNRL
jgi:hypothetical protein